MSTYRIIRFYRDERPREVIDEGRTREEAQAWCSLESTHGPDFFDGYESEGGDDE
jgi:hypothetical protein